jgi:hypothetical protein
MFVTDDIGNEVVPGAVTEEPRAAFAADVPTSLLSEFAASADVEAGTLKVVLDVAFDTLMC